MLIKSCTEEFLQKSGLNFTIFRMCGFMQVRGPLARRRAHPAVGRFLIL